MVSLTFVSTRIDCIFVTSVAYSTFLVLYNGTYAITTVYYYYMYIHCIHVHVHVEAKYFRILYRRLQTFSSQLFLVLLTRDIELRIICRAEIYQCIRHINIMHMHYYMICPSV